MRSTMSSKSMLLYPDVSCHVRPIVQRYSSLTRHPSLLSASRWCEDAKGIPKRPTIPDALSKKSIVPVNHPRGSPVQRRECK